MQAKEQPIHTEMGSCIRWSDDSTSIKQFASAHNQALVTLTHTKLGYNECYRKQSKAKALKQFSSNNKQQHVQAFLHTSPLRDVESTASLVLWARDCAVSSANRRGAWAETAAECEREGWAETAEG
jgi:hypothetical protein